MMPSSVQIAYSSNKFVNRASELQTVQETIERVVHSGTDFSSQTIVFLGKLGIGKTWLLQHLVSNLKEQEDIIIYSICMNDYQDEEPDSALSNILVSFHKLIFKDDRTIEGTNLPEKSRILFEQLHQDRDERPIILVFDSVFETDWEVLDQFEDYFLGPCAIEPRVLIIMAGRNRPYPWKTPELRLKAQFLELSPFTCDETEQQLAILELSENKPLQEIYHLSGGVPYVSYLLANGLNASAVVTQLLTTIPEERYTTIREYLEALCILRVFDEERIPTMLAAYYQDDAYRTISYRQASQIRNELVTHALARWDGDQGGYVIDADIRTLLEASLQQEEQSREIWFNLHRTAHHLYIEWEALYPGAASRWQAEISYHAEKLNRVTA